MYSWGSWKHELHVQLLLGSLRSSDSQSGCSALLQALRALPVPGTTSCAVACAGKDSGAHAQGEPCASASAPRQEARQR